MKVEHYYPTNNHLLTEPKYGRTKRIKIWINGDIYCNEFSINPNNFRSWISILNHFSIMMKPAFGAIRKLVALSSMRVVDCFEDLDPYDKYVALGASCRLKFPPGGYTSNSEKELLNQQKVKKKLYKGEINYQKSPFLIESEKKKLTIIYITVNGRHCQVPQKAIFKENELKNWNIIMIYLSKILDIPEGVESICTIFGDVLEKPIQFQHGFLYVAIPFKESFTDMDYLSLFKKENNFRKNYILSIKPTNGSASNRGSPRVKISTLPTYRIEKGRVNPEPCSPKVSSEKEQSMSSEPFQARSKAAYDKHLQRCATVRRRVNSARMKKEVADSIKAYEQRIEKIEKEKLQKSRTYYEIAKRKHIKKPRGQTEVEIIHSPPCSSRTKRNSREAKPDSGYNSEDRKSMIESMKSGSGDGAVRRKTFISSAKSEAALVRKISSDETTLGSSSSTITLKSGSKSGHCKQHDDISGVPISSIKDSGIPTLTKSSTTVTTDSEDFTKNVKGVTFVKEFSTDFNIERNRSGAISVIKEVSEGPSSLSETETKEILSPKGRQMFSTSSDSIKDTSSEEKSCEKVLTAPKWNVQKANSSTDRLRALFRTCSCKEDNNSEEEKRNNDCKSSYTDSLLEQTDSDSDLLKDSMENIDQTTFGKIAGSKSSERKHVTINYSNRRGNRTTSCPTIMMPQNSPSSFANMTRKSVDSTALVPLVSSLSQTSSLDVNSGSHFSCKSNECLKTNEEQNNQIVLRGDVNAKSTDSFSIEKFIIKSEDVTVCEISNKEATSTTVIVVKEIERAEYSKIISSTKIIEVSDSLEALPESDVQSQASSYLANDQV